MDANEPDKWDRAHVYKRLTGFGHLLTQQAADNKSNYSLISGMASRLDEIQTELAERDAAIGELKGQLAELAEKHEKMAGWLKDKEAKERAKNGVGK